MVLVQIMQTKATQKTTVWWTVVLCACLLTQLDYVHAACSTPLGIANGYITSTSPYNTGDRVVFRCYDGFTMSGTPSQLCDASGSFLGTAPSCAANDQAVTVKQTVTSPKDNNGWMMLAFGSFVGLILLLLIVFTLVFFYFMYKGQQRGGQERRLQTRTAFTHRDSFRHTSTSSYPGSQIGSD